MRCCKLIDENYRKHKKLDRVQLDKTKTKYNYNREIKACFVINSYLLIIWIHFLVK